MRQKHFDVFDCLTIFQSFSIVRMFHKRAITQGRSINHCKVNIVRRIRYCEAVVSLFRYLKFCDDSSSCFCGTIVALIKKKLLESGGSISTPIYSLINVHKSKNPFH